MQVEEWIVEELQLEGLGQMSSRSVEKLDVKAAEAGDKRANHASLNEPHTFTGLEYDSSMARNAGNKQNQCLGASK